MTRTFLELFGGCAHLSGSFSQVGCHIAPPFELANGKWFGLCHPSVFRVVLGWIRIRVVWLVHFAPPCAFFSQAHDALKKERLKSSGLATARATVWLLQCCKRLNSAWILENPKTSAIFRWPPLHRFLLRSDNVVIYIGYCECGIIASQQFLFQIGKSLHSLLALVAVITIMMFWHAW